MDIHIDNQLRHIRDYEADRRSKYRALIVLVSSVLIFSLSALGLFDWLSQIVADSLSENLGYTNKWSKSFRPEWFVGLNRDIAAFAGYPILFICLSIIIIYYNLRNENRRLWRLIFIILGGGFLLFSAKVLFANRIPDSPLEFLKYSYYGFPSGHAMIGTIFYLTLAVTISRRQHSDKTKRLTLISAAVIIILIGISRILPGFHTVSEVLAGWSFGMIWLCLCWILERRIKKNLKNGRI